MPVPADDFDKPLHYSVLGYKVMPRVLDISRDMNFVSMKDQIIRGRWVVDALINAKVLETSTAPSGRPDECDLLVIGAGAAGVAAAMRAAHQNVRTLIVDRADDAFVRQSYSQRLISPSLYDWPAQHWDKQPWPHDEPVAYPPVSSPVSAAPAGGTHDPSVLIGSSVRGGVVDTAANFAAQWKGQFDSLRRSTQYLVFESHCGLEYDRRAIRGPLIFGRDRLRVSLAYVKGHRHAGRWLIARPQFVLFALGPGPENTTVTEGRGGTYVGPRFWVAEEGARDRHGRVDDDALLRHPIVGESGRSVEQLLISGAGDGRRAGFPSQLAASRLA